MAPLATVFVTVLPNMTLFTATMHTALRSQTAALSGLGATQGAAYASAFNRSALGLLAGGAALGLGILVKEAVQAAGNFEAAMVRLTTSAGETGTLVGGNLKIVADGIKDMAAEVGFSVGDLGKAMYLVESAGFRAADGLNVLRFAAEASKAENSDLSTVVDALTTAMVDYHKPASDAADVMNTLLAAAATSKVNLQDLAKSLHSVLPAASAAGIGLDDILAALSSMTLHGFSAQQATQNLADVIRHMQNPTNVQARELALLGLTTNQLADSLRSKGLTGTLQMISERIRNLMPPGSNQVILNLQTAFSKLSKPVQELAQKLLDGTVSFAEYRKAARDLTPIQNAQAMSFYNLASQTHRIGDEQMTGAKALQVYSQALARATGDATGMNVALMLTGANAETTQDILNRIGQAALESGGHVKGWAAIQETFNFRLAQTKAAFGVLGVAIGESLLPPLEEMLKIITMLLGPMAEFIDQNETLTAVIFGLVSAFVAIGTTILIVQRLAAGIRALAAAMRLAAIAQFLFLSPWGLIILAITAVVAALVYAYFHFEGFRKVADTVFRGVMVAVRLWWEYAKFAFEQYRRLIMDVIVPASIWLWKHVLEPAFHAITIATKAWWEYAKFAFEAWRTIIMEYVVPAAIWLWQHVLVPAFHAIVIAIKAWWEYAKFAFNAWRTIIMDVLIPIAQKWWEYAKFVFDNIRNVLNAWWIVIRVIFEAFKITVDSFLIQPILFLWEHVIKPVWNGISIYIQLKWAEIKVVWKAITDGAGILGDVFIALWRTKIEPAWNAIRLIIAIGWQYIKPIFETLVDVIKVVIPSAFRDGVELVRRAWDLLKGFAASPINFVIEFVINKGLIKMWNTLKGWFNVGGPEIKEIPLIRLADGGPIRGVGGPRQDNIPIMASAGEYVIPAHVVSALGVDFFNTLIGRRKPIDKAGDGSQGIAIGRYADGGLVDFIMNPVNWVGSRVNGAINKIPGGGLIRDISVSASKKLVEALINWAKDKLNSLVGGNISAITPLKGGAGGILGWLFAQHGKPYGWAQAGPGSYDCSGIVSAVWNLMHGLNPYRHTFSTMGQSLFFPKRNQFGLLTAGWANPGERGGGSVGHTAGVFAGVGFESTGSRGVRVGAGTTPVTNFAHWGTFADGGLIRSFDRGGPWPSGTIGANTSGRTEYVSSGDAMDRVERLLERIENAVDRVAPALGRELHGNANAMYQMARAR